eukprot:TRINITY_DN4959_c0_g1_i1.p1 TRINITY_DN4959_c0_g1~~TRINITY_DN4959_c0_g1_i1.p1  ORF type:complete len:300 (+),score=52.66 TRINITY_DN4959_c0_g1_i1:56-901(+)
MSLQFEDTTDDSDVTLSPRSSHRGSFSQGPSTCARSQRTGRPGSRRYQRFLNALFLNPAVTPEQLLELDDEQLKELENDLLYTPEFASHFDELFKSEENMKAFAPFCDVTEEEQQQLLAGLNDNSEHVEPFDFASASPEVQSELLFLSIERSTRDLLKKERNLPLVISLEAHLLSHFAPEVVPQPSRLDLDLFKTVSSPQKKPTNKQSFAVGTADDLCLLFKSSLDRRICHGVCRYYALLSASENTLDEGERVTVITKSKAGSRLHAPLLSRYLQKITTKP